ncbi:MAG: phosphohistidine phosphatase SixA [Nitrosopumilus sp.]|nr:phosphohistidine phosphatase SixA [Nitrosopumilus sp.]
MELYIIRHGKAEEVSQNISSDAKRRLTKTGVRELEYVSKALKIFGIQVDYIFTSPLVRAQETAEIIAKQLLVKKKKNNYLG